MKKEIIEHISNLATGACNNIDISGQVKTWCIEDTLQVGEYEYYISGYVSRDYNIIPGNHFTPGDEEDSQNWDGDVLVVKSKNEEEVEHYNLYSNEDY